MHPWKPGVMMASGLILCEKQTDTEKKQIDWQMMWPQHNLLDAESTTCVLDVSTQNKFQTAQSFSE